MKKVVFTLFLLGVLPVTILALSKVVKKTEKKLEKGPEIIKKDRVSVLENKQVKNKKANSKEKNSSGGKGVLINLLDPVEIVDDKSKTKSKSKKD